MLSRLLDELKAAEVEMNKIDEAYENNPENNEIEAVWMERYTRERNAHEAVVQFLLKALKAGGMKDIKRSTVNKMIAENRDKLTEIAALL